MIFSLLLALALMQAPAAQAAQLPSAPAPAQVTRASYGERLKLSGLPNGGRINAWLYRGAQPQTEGMQQLRSLGITTIVDLRGEDVQKSEWERQQAERLGIHFVRIPVSGWNPPSNEQLAQFLSLFRSNPKEKVYVHCRLGEDRTGVFVAAYRMAFDGWSSEQAMNEMYFFGFNGMWHSSMKTFIRAFPSQLKTESVFADYRPHQDETVTKCDRSSVALACAN
jgi:protein tyrosine/serine phosphatase